ncbi:transcription factor CP2-like protein 1 isoform X3 [Leucoraja erinacea]|uniref:transcription factor CP2-like protein 1 isoform X3 n=1 Tax=Leucoraja erinaceus TaxID=7782 RepID=UPI00245907C9|nr:transcription factor CP2-like protein 1 isoform X3 [Leucoraja erinacea]
MLYWHNQTEHYWPAQTEHYHQYVNSNAGRDVLPLPLFKHEDSALSTDHEPSAVSFQYVLSAATSPAVKLHEETLTYLNQGQSYEIRMLCNQNIRGLMESNGKLLKVHCISTEFTPRKNGGEKGVPFRIQIDTFKMSENGDYTEPLHSASCQVKVFKPKGADRKLKTDREKVEKRSPQERSKYQPAFEATVLTECSPWPDTVSTSNTSPARSPGYSPDSPIPFHATEGGCSSPTHQGDRAGLNPIEHLSPTLTIQETQQWLHRHRFTTFCKLFANFSGADLLKLSRDDIIQICGPADGIRLFNALRLRSIRPRLTIYMCREPQQGKETDNSPDTPSTSVCVYKEIYLEDLTKAELTNKLAALFSISPNQILQIYRQGVAGIHILVGDQMIQNLPDESSFIINSLKVDSLGGYYMILK